MAENSVPPTRSMREEWSGLSSETRGAVLDLLFSKERPNDESLIERLEEIGISHALTQWIVEDALVAMRRAERRLFENRMKAAPARSKQEYFNRVLGSTAFLILVIAWLAQDAMIFRHGEFPISLPFATVLFSFAVPVFLSALSSWLRSLRK